ncbi:hypothetical protein [Micromonospora sp. NPDC047730]|uniref:hypothetical protein n=1 Tax=Micromonospora sp. NPDC047730 TaxID=3364253 RepID=UPI00371737DC
MNSRLPLVAALLAAVALAGCSDSEPTATTPTSPGASAATSPTASATAAASPSPSSSWRRNSLQCGHVERAYTTWNGDRVPATAADVQKFDEVDLKRTMNDSKVFMDAVTGYGDQASKDLVVAVAEYNVEVGMANLQLTVDGKLDGEQAGKVAKAATGVHAAYRKFVEATCL